MTEEEDYEMRIKRKTGEPVEPVRSSVRVGGQPVAQKFGDLPLGSYFRRPGVAHIYLKYGRKNEMKIGGPGYAACLEDGEKHYMTADSSVVPVKTGTVIGIVVGLPPEEDHDEEV